MPFIATTAEFVVLKASYSIRSKNYNINNDNHAEFTYPIDGWEYVENLPGEEELKALPKEMDVKTTEAFITIGNYYKITPTQLFKIVIDSKYSELNDTLQP